MQDYCKATYENVKFLRQYGKEISDKIHFVRFEDVASEPVRRAGELYSFMGLPVTDSLNKWLINTTTYTGEKLSPFRTERNAKLVIGSWRRTLSYELVKMIQEDCWNAMSISGYKLATSEEELRNYYVSLVGDLNP